MPLDSLCRQRFIHITAAQGLGLQRREGLTAECERRVLYTAAATAAAAGVF